MGLADVDKTYVQKSTGKESSAMSEPLVLISVLTACTMFVVFFLVMWVIAPKVGTTDQSAPIWMNWSYIVIIKLYMRACCQSFV